MNHYKSLISLISISIFCLTHNLAQTSPCGDGEMFKKLDFWVGEWKVLNPQGQVAGHNKITKILDDCALLEEWTGSGPSTGKSLNFYHPVKKHWQQVWVNNFGSPLELIGVPGKDLMTYTGVSVNPQGKQVLNEMVLSKVNDDEVRQLWRQSPDDGKTWNTVFDGRYHRQTTE